MIYVSLLEGIRCMLTLQVSILLCVLCWVLIESGNLSREAYKLHFRREKFMFHTCQYNFDSEDEEATMINENNFKPMQDNMV
jgi:hypothetical protein